MTPAKKSRPKKLSGDTYKMRCGCGNIFLTVNEDDDGLFETFVRFGKGGGCSSTIGESVGRLISLAFRCGGSADDAIKQISGLTCHQQLPSVDGKPPVLSCVDALAQMLRAHLASKTELPPQTEKKEKK